MYLPYIKRKVVFCSQKVEELVNSMGFVVGSKSFNVRREGKTLPCDK
jgi:fatty-acid desaturase